MSAAHQLSELEYPPILKPLLVQIGEYFPEGVEHDKVTGGISIKASLTREQQVALAFFRLFFQSSEVLCNLNVVINDMFALALRPPALASEGERRYFLLTRLFFYEIARLRDILPRFLKYLEEANVVEKKERKEVALQAQRLFEEHYSIRNVFLHGPTFPRTGGEIDLSLLAGLEQDGYVPSLAKKGGGLVTEYPDILKKLAVDRSDALYRIGSDTFRLVQSIMTVLALHIAHHDLKMDISHPASRSGP